MLDNVNRTHLSWLVTKLVLQKKESTTFLSSLWRINVRKLDPRVFGSEIGTTLAPTEVPASVCYLLTDADGEKNNGRNFRMTTDLSVAP